MRKLHNDMEIYFSENYPSLKTIELYFEALGDCQKILEYNQLRSLLI